MDSTSVQTHPLMSPCTGKEWTMQRGLQRNLPSASVFTSLDLSPKFKEKKFSILFKKEQYGYYYMARGDCSVRKVQRKDLKKRFDAYPISSRRQWSMFSPSEGLSPLLDFYPTEKYRAH